MYAVYISRKASVFPRPALKRVSPGNMKKNSVKNKKVLIIGAQGMLGSDLAKVFAPYKPILWGQKDLDITDAEKTREKIVELSPDMVINAAAYTNVPEAEKNQDLANNVNGYAVGYLAGACHLIGATLVHYSTDYVFDGKKEKGYKEDDEGNPISAYGASKYLGEQMLFLKESQGGVKCPSFAHCSKIQAGRGCDELEEKPKFKYYLIRTSWLYGAKGKNFVDTMLNLAEKGDKLKVVKDQFGKPSSTLDLAKRTWELIESGAPYGVYHLTNETADEKAVSWYDFAVKIFEIRAKIHKTYKIPEIQGITSAEFADSVKRPVYSMLINTKLSPSRKWEEALEDYLKSKFNI